MKKTFIKLVSVFTAIMIVSGVLAGINFTTTSAVTVNAVDMNFDGSYTATSLAEKGFAASGQTLETIAGYIADNKLTVPQTVSPVGLYSPAITDTSYTVQTDITVIDENSSGTTSAGLLIGAPEAEYKSCYFVEGRINADGKFQEIRIREIKANGGASGALGDGVVKIASSANYVPMGTTVTLKVDVVYDATTGTTVTASIVLNGTALCTTSFTKADGTITGRAAIYKLTSTSQVSFDNLRVTTERDSYFDMQFTGSYTGGALSAMGYASSNQTLETVAGYIAEGKITYPKDTQKIGFYSPAINADSYTVSTDLTIVNASKVASYGMLVGAPDAAYASCYYIEVLTSTNGTINKLRARQISSTGNAAGTKFETDAATLVSAGATATLAVLVVYDEDTQETTLIATVKTNGEDSISRSFTVDGKIQGRAAIFKNHTSGGVSFDNFKAVPYEEPQEPVDPNAFFTDKFNDDKNMTENGWQNDSSGIKASGVYTLNATKSNYVSGVTDAATWTDYAVTAKVKTGIDALPTDDSSNIVSIVARTTSNAAQGYEFRICADKNGTYYRLYKRGPAGGKINGETPELHKDIDLTQTHNLKIIVMGARVLCYNGDELIFDITDNYEDNVEYSAGYAGVRAPVGTGIYDDFIVRKITDEEKAAIEALTPPTPPTPPEEEDLPENILYQDDFESSKTMAQEGWNATSETGTKANGVFTVNSGKATYLTGVTDSDKWDDYVIEGDIGYNSGTATDVTSITNLVVRSTQTTTNGYEFGIRYNADGTTEIRLYKRRPANSTLKAMELTLPYAVLPDTLYHAKLVVLGDRLIGYFNGIKMFDVIDNEAYMEGYAGIRNAGSGYTSNFDNITVRKILTSDIVEDKKIDKLKGDVWFKDDFNDETSLTERGWDNDAAEFTGGAVTLVRTSNSMYISGVDGAEKWTDYTVSADVTIDKSQGLFADQTMGATWISARSTKLKSSGYEFGIMTYQSGKTNLRLFDRTDNEEIMVIDSYNVTEGTHQLKMIVQANTIRCYFDGELVMTATDDTNKAGYAGLRASGYVANYDNFRVSAIKEEQKLDIVTPETEETPKSPVTGVARAVCTVVAPISFALSLLALVISAVWAVVNRKRIF